MHTRLCMFSFLAALCAAFGPVDAAEPEGVLLCTAKGGGFDCERGKCNASRVTVGADLRFDFAAKTLCALSGGECKQPKALQHAMIEEPSKTIVAAASGENATMVFRIGADNAMSMVFLVGTNRVISFAGECRKP